MRNAMNFKTVPARLPRSWSWGCWRPCPWSRWGAARSAQDKPGNQVPAISTFTGGTLPNGVFTPVTKGTNLSFPWGARRPSRRTSP